MPGNYKFLLDRALWFYEWLWNVSKNPEFITPIMNITAKWANKSIRRAIENYNPDLIIAVHPLLQEVPLKILAFDKRRVPFVTVVTDFTAFHPTWFHPEVTLCFVPNEVGYRRALEAGLRPSQLRQCGLPIHPAFGQAPGPRKELRHKLGMDPDAPAVLLVGGGEGMGRIEAIAEAVAGRLAAQSQGHGKPAGQLVVICGRNRKLEGKLNSFRWPIPTRVAGFVTNMADWMAASDCIITKAGPGTIAEAMARGLPILLSGYIPGQETENVSFVVENGVGVYEPDPRQIACLVSRWFRAGWADLEQMSYKAQQLARPQAAFNIVEEIADMSVQPDLALERYANITRAGRSKTGRRPLPRWLGLHRAD